MPDISMCGSFACPLASSCYRSPQSGTKPSEFRQAWAIFGWVLNKRGEVECPHHWPVPERKPTTPEAP